LATKGLGPLGLEAWSNRALIAHAWRKSKGKDARALMNEEFITPNKFH